MIEVAHRQHGSPSFHSSSSPSSSRSTPDLTPLPIRHLKAPPSPLVNNFVTSSVSGEEEGGVNDNSVVSSQERKSLNGIATKGPGSINYGQYVPGKGTSYAPFRVRGESLSPLSTSGSTSPRHPMMHRIRKGQKLEDLQPVISTGLPSLQSIDSPFQLQEYLSLLIRLDPREVDRIVALPQPVLESSKNLHDGVGIEKGKGRDNEASPFPSMEEEVQSVDTDVWIYEQLRRIVLDFSTPWLTLLQKDCDKGNKPKTCEAMNADDWMYLCASHGEEKQCCAIDYIIHTLDGTTALLNSQRHFPSRTYIPTTSLRHFGSVSRRLNRIFVHAFEHHRDVFEACEAETSLYARFIALVQTYDLIAVESLPQLGKSTGRVSDKAEQADSLSTELRGESEGDFVGRDRAGALPTATEGIPDAGRKRQLFEAEIASAEGEQNEDEDELVEGEAGQGHIEEAAEVQARLADNFGRDRSDSNASRMTAFQVPTSSQESSSPIEHTIEDEPEVTRDKLTVQREKPGQEEVPQDVKDDEDDE